MTIGMIFECGPQGADVQVCQILARHLQPKIEIVPVTLDNKPNLIQNCGDAAAGLLASGCERVIIVWDLYPAWRIKGQRPCRHEDREEIFASLSQAGVHSDQVALVCIQEELEAWLIADERAVSTLLSTSTHPVHVPRVRKPERQSNPKKYLNRLFEQNGRGPYSDRIHAGRIVQAMDGVERLLSCPTFVRFAEKVSGTKI